VPFGDVTKFGAKSVSRKGTNLVSRVSLSPGRETLGMRLEGNAWVLDCPFSFFLSTLSSLAKTPIHTTL